MNESRQLTSEDIYDIFGHIFIALLCVLGISPLILIFLIITHDIEFSDTIIAIGNIGLNIYWFILIALALAAFSCLALAYIQERKEKKEREKREIANMVLLEMQRQYHSKQNKPINNNPESNAQIRRVYKQTTLVRQRLVKKRK